MANKISVVLDVVADKAVSGIKGFRKSVDDADGAMGKMKAGAGSAFDSIKANAGVAAAAAGAAIVTFAAKSIGAFQDVALEAGKFADISGLAVEDASKWIEVADHIDVNAGVLEKSFGKLNAAIAKGGSVLGEYGIEAVKAADGTTDANATFLATIDTIKGIHDPLKRAQASQAAFGKGWQEMSELINMGSEEIVKQMGKVGDAKVIDEGELAKARAFRGSMDDLGDSVQEVAIDVGEELIPAVTVAAEVLSSVAPIVGKLVGVVGDAFIKMSDMAYDFGAALADMADALPFVDIMEATGPTLYEWSKLERGTADLVAEFSKGKPTVKELADAIVGAGYSVEEASLASIEYKKQLDGVHDKTGEVIDVTDELTESVDYTKAGQEAAGKMIDQVNATYNRQVDAVEAAADALRDLTADMLDAVGGAFDLEQATLDLNGAYAAYQESVMTTTDTLKSSEATDREKEQALRDLREQEIGVAGDALATAEAYAQEQGAADGSAESAQFQKDKLQELAAAMPELRDEIQKYIDKLNNVPGVITTRFEITATGATVTPHGDLIGVRPGSGGSNVVGASGGIVTRPTLAWIGERGPEAVIPLSHTLGSMPLPSGGSFATGPSVTFVVEGNINGDKHLTAQLDKWARNVQREIAGAA